MRSPLHWVCGGGLLQVYTGLGVLHWGMRSPLGVVDWGMTSPLHLVCGGGLLQEGMGSV